MKHISVKLLLCISLVMLFTVLLIPAISAAGAPALTAFSVNPYGNGADAVDTVNWQQVNGNYYLFLPSGTSFDEARIYFTASAPVYINGTPVENGSAASVFTEARKAYTLTCGSESYSLIPVVSADVKTVFIKTDHQPLSYIHQNKNNKDSGTLRSYDENGDIDVDKTLKQLKGRGNATWNYVKKPYNIKFDKKTSIFGMSKAKKWTFLAGCVFDNALMKNSTVFDISRKIGLEESSEFRHTDLYINGEYLGNYLICESVEIGENRIDTVDLDNENEDANDGYDIEAAPLMGTRSGYVPGSKKWVDIPNDPACIEGGYLLEVDYLYRYHEEISGFISNVGMPVVIKSPEYASLGEVNYISSLWNEAEEALYADNGVNSLGKHYTEYFDMDSLALVYIIQELSKNVDSGITSFYFYKTADSDKFHAGPVWDFDHALGYGTNIAGGQLTIWESNTWYANQLRRSSIDTATNAFMTFFAQCYTYEDFRTAVSAKWVNGVSGILNNTAKTEYEAYADKLVPSAVMNHIRWNTFGTTDFTAVEQNYRKEADKLLTFIFDRKTTLDKGLAADGAVVYYRKNGGGGSELYDATVYSIGEKATAKNCPYVLSGYEFDSWNTSADGTGTKIKAGEAFTVSGNYVSLYAQWKTATEKPASHCSHICHQGGFMGFIWKIINVFYKLFGINQYCECGAKHW